MAAKLLGFVLRTMGNVNNDEVVYKADAHTDDCLFVWPSWHLIRVLGYSYTIQWYRLGALAFLLVVWATQNACGVSY